MCRRLLPNSSPDNNKIAKSLWERVPTGFVEILNKKW